VFVALLAFGLLRADGPPAPGEVAPEFSAELLGDDGGLALADLRGAPVVLNFWASWCAPCKDEAPVLERVWRENRARGLVVVGYDAQDFRRDARAFLRRFDLTFPVVYDGPGTNLADWGVTGFPETFVIDRRGRVVDAIVGAVDNERDQERLREATERALES
jgi:cytochrome c biogenesis protein CcmG/thiol:disulfide interchange protein DsbE